jgi:hypothetical protein
MIGSIITIIGGTETVGSLEFQGRKYIQYTTGGKLHRIGGPAIEYEDGEYEWWLNGNRHRLDGPAVNRLSGVKLWYKHGNYHRIGGPAYKTSGDKKWYVDGVLHREDGPAVVLKDGTVEYWLSGKQYTKDKFRELTHKRGPIAVDSHHRSTAVQEAYSITTPSGAPVIKGNYNRHIQVKSVTFGEVTEEQYRLGPSVHRLDGPAIIFSDGTKQWFIYGKQYTEEEYNYEIAIIKEKLRHVRIDGVECYVESIEFL